MKLLVAKRDADGRWQKAAVLNAYADGRRLRNVPAKHHGGVPAMLAGMAAHFFAGEPAARTVNYTVPDGEYRVDLVDPAPPAPTTTPCPVCGGIATVTVGGKRIFWKDAMVYGIAADAWCTC